MMVCRVLLISILGISPAFAQAAAGWRTDGAGKYPSATPVTEWSPTKNVVWKTKMPSWSNASPVLAGGRIFVCSEPFTLLCIDAKDGEILWQKTNSYLDALAPEAAAKERGRVEKRRKIAVKAKAIQKEQRATNEERERVTRELKQIAEELLPKPGGRRLTEEEREKETAREADLEKKAETLNKRLADLKPLAETQTRELAALKRQWDSAKPRRLPRTHETNGYSSSTPVTDGTHVYALFGNGFAACYDLDGNRIWIRFVERSGHGRGNCASPVLIDGKLIVKLRGVTALDAKTGKTLWQAPAAHRWGSPVVTRVGGTDVLVTPAGELIRISDGKVLATRMSDLTYCAPIVHDGVAYFVQHGGKALEFSPGPENGVTVKPLWTTTPKKDRYYASPLLHDGLIYAMTQSGHLSVIDAKTGAVTYQRRLKFGRGPAYPSITLAGSHLFLSREDGTTVVMTLGREPTQVAVNKLELFRTCPVFAGKRMIVRTAANLYCIGE